MENQNNNQLVVFQDKKIRRVWHNEEWWFSVVDIVEVLTSSPNPRKYWSVLKTRLKSEGSQLATNCSQLKMQSLDGKYYFTDVGNTEQILRLVQSIPSPKAEPFKRWLAMVGYERIQEIENPELAYDRARKYYEMKGYPHEWIQNRLWGTAIRQELTNEWKKRGIEDSKDFAILTNEINKAIFGMSTMDHKHAKKLDPKLKNQNLRDNMTELEGIFSMLGEKLTTEVARKEDVSGFEKNKEAAKKGGGVAGRARIAAEKVLGKSIAPKRKKGYSRDALNN